MITYKAMELHEKLQSTIEIPAAKEITTALWEEIESNCTLSYEESWILNSMVLSGKLLWALIRQIPIWEKPMMQTNGDTSAT